MSKRSRKGGSGAQGKLSGQKSEGASWRTVIIISVVVVAVILLMYALDMTRFMDGGG